jgi:hypothetical protein
VAARLVTVGGLPIRRAYAASGLGRATYYRPRGGGGSKVLRPAAARRSPKTTYNLGLTTIIILRSWPFKLAFYSELFSRLPYSRDQYNFMRHTDCPATGKTLLVIPILRRFEIC